MSQHPLDSLPDDRTFSPAPSDIAEEDYGFPDSRSSRASSPLPDNIVRATSPFGRRYLKPINGIQTKGFASSAKRRSSVLTLGSIERLQQFYANKDLKVNKIGMLGFKRDTLSEEPDELDQLPTPQAPPPSWKDLDVETDLDVLLEICFEDIQNMLTQWAMVTGPREHPSYSSQGSRSSNESDDGFQILPLLDSVTKMINSVKNYVYQRHDLSDTAMRQVRRATLDLLAALKVLEHRFREDTDEHGEHTYRTSDFGMLEKERQAIHEYLQTIEKSAFNPPHHIGSPPAVYTPEIKSLLAKTAVRQEPREEQKPVHGIPVWLERGSFVDDNLGRYHALLNENRPSGTGDIPDPHEDEDAFLKHLADGIVLCHAYNNIVKRSRRPFGFINKIHSDTRRTYRAIENLRFFAAACSFRFDLTFKSFDPAEIARKTDQGLNSLKQVIEAFCEGVIKELRQYADLVKARQSMLFTPNMQQDIAKYLQEKLAIDSDAE